MLGERVKKFTKLMFTGLTMALCVVAFSPSVKTEATMLQESEPNDNPAQANQLPLNMWMKGTVQGNDQDWYQFTISQSGVSQIEIARDAENTYEDYTWAVSLEDANRHQLAYFYTNSKNYKIGLAPGKYYIRLNQSHGYSVAFSYNLKVSHTPSDSWEQERYYGDKSLSNANIVYANKIYTGKLYCRDDVDWYRFKLNGNNKLSLRFTIDDTVLNPEIWRIELIEYNSRKSLGRYDLDTNETLTVDKCSGDLIVKVWSGYGGAIGDIYHLQLATTPIISSSNTNVKPSTSSTKKPATVKKPSATKITSIKAGKRKATVRWKKASNATGYYVYRSTSPRGKYKKVATITGRTYYTDKKSLKSRKNYYYKVVSIRKSGSKVLKSKASGYKRVKVK